MQNLRIKKGWKRKCKAKPFINFNSIDMYPIDSYPDKDLYIPIASAKADKIAKKEGAVNPQTGKVERKTKLWTRAFMTSMDLLLSEADLRVL